MKQYFHDIPVYKIKDHNLKNRLAKAVLKNVTAKDGQLNVTHGY